MRTREPQLSTVVSGSFHRHMEAISRAVQDLASRSIRVLSPADPRIVAAQGDFLFVASDRLRSIRLVQDRHLQSIRAADFLWLVCPDGYVGQSASMEVGFAAAAGVPIFSTRAPSDLTLREYVIIVPTILDAVRSAQVSPSSNRSEGILINPHASAEEAHRTVDRIEKALTGQCGSGDPARQVYRDMTNLRRKLQAPAPTSMR
jgi:hypothetical protein